MIRLKSDIWAAAWLRRCASAGVPAYLRKRGVAEAGAIYLKIDCLNGECVVFGPADQSAYDENASDRLFRRMHEKPRIGVGDAETLLARELRFDQDIWILEADDSDGRSFADSV